MALLYELIVKILSVNIVIIVKIWVKEIIFISQKWLPCVSFSHQHQRRNYKNYHIYIKTEYIMKENYIRIKNNKHK